MWLFAGVLGCDAQRGSARGTLGQATPLLPPAGGQHPPGVKGAPGFKVQAHTSVRLWFLVRNLGYHAPDTAKLLSLPRLCVFPFLPSWQPLFPCPILPVGLALCVLQQQAGAEPQGTGKGFPKLLKFVSISLNAHFY